MRKKSSGRTTARTSYQGRFLTLKRIFVLLFLGCAAFALTTIIQQHRPLPTCANSKSCLSDQSEKIENNTLGVFEGHPVSPPHIDPQVDLAPAAVLGESTATGDKHIYVDLSTQTLYAYQGSTLILKTFISSGKWHDTPVGNFHIWSKLRATRMSGGEGADAYDLPNVPYVLYFYHDFGLHGAYWHDNFGHAMSHGCVNMRSVDAKVIFDWADGPSGGQPGTAVSICNQVIGEHECVQQSPIQ